MGFTTTTPLIMNNNKEVHKPKDIEQSLALYNDIFIIPLLASPTMEALSQESIVYLQGFLRRVLERG
jgi:hypothetical protein